jgi:hypothetical protein
MKADEIVRALRAKSDGNYAKYMKTLPVKEREPDYMVFSYAADLIESLQAKLAEANEQINWDNELVKKLEAELAEARKDCDITDAANTALYGALAESRRREKAAEDALLDMTVQFSSFDGEMRHTFMSAEEHAYAVLGIGYGEKISAVCERYSEKWHGKHAEKGKEGKAND